MRTGEEIQLAAKHFRSKPFHFWTRIWLVTAASWCCRFVTVNLIVLSCINLNWSDQLTLLAKQLVMWLFLIITPTPGGSGMAEFTFSELLANQGESLMLITFLAIIWRLITYYPYLFVGAFLLPKWLKRS